MDYNEFKVQLITRVKQLREEKQLTQEQLSEKMRVSESSISKIESYARTPSLEMIFKIAQALNVKIEHLFRF